MTLDGLDDLLDRIEQLAAEVDTFDPHVREVVLELLDVVELLHRSAVSELADQLGDRVQELAGSHPAIAWLFAAYDVTAAGGAPVEATTAEGGADRRAALPIYPG